MTDFCDAVRVLSKERGFTAVAILTLALGIGTTTAMFSVVYGVLLKPLPFHEPARLVSLNHHAPTGAGGNHGPATYFTYRDNHQAFEAIGAWETNDVSITGGGDPQQVEALAVTVATLPLLRVRPLLGRLFDAKDDEPGSPLRAVLTYGYWQRRFGGARSVVGRPLVIDGVSAEIIGVLPSTFTFLHVDPALLLPMQLDRSEAFRGIIFDFQALARLKPGVTLAQANSDVARMIPLLPPVYDRLRLGPRVLPLADSIIGQVGGTLWILMAAGGAVLLIACGNVANLFLISTERRQQELLVRAALGATRGRLAWALLTHSFVLALAGCALGVPLALAAIGLLRRLAPAQLPRVDGIGMDPAVLLFALSVSLLSALGIGVFAVLRFGTPGVTTLKEGGRSPSDAPGRLRARHALVVGQIALALTLTIVAGLMMRTLIALLGVEPGFNKPEQVQTFRIAIPEGLISDLQLAARTHESIADRLAQVPGVISVGLSSSITMDGEDNGNYLEVENAPRLEGTPSPLRRFKSFGPGYFETMGNPLVAGRSVTWTEIYERRPVFVISETLAREYWDEPSRAIGRRVRGSNRNPWREIVGVAGAERDDGLHAPATAIVYWPLLNDTYLRRAIAYAVRSTRVGTPGFVRELQQAVWSVNPNLPLAAVQTLEEIMARSMARTSFAMTMLAIAAGVALLLGLVGIYGVVAYVATQRTREIGIRMALGAQVRDIRGMFLSQGLRLTGAGMTLGLVITLAFSRAASALLFGVGPADPVTYGTVSAALAAVALVATYLPARRAALVDPVAALRAEVT